MLAGVQALLSHPCPFFPTFWSLFQGPHPCQPAWAPPGSALPLGASGLGTDVTKNVRAWMGDGAEWAERGLGAGLPTQAHTEAQVGVLMLRDNPIPGFCPPRGQPYSLKL